MMSRGLDIYTDHFGLTMRPFALLPDPDFLFWSPGHRRAFAMLEYGLLTRAPITLITGDVGAGKTTLLHHLLRGLPGDLRIGLVANPSGDREDLLRFVLSAFDQPSAPGGTYVDLFNQLQSYLIAEYAEGRRVVLVFDEAQSLSPAALEELRMLTNINRGQDELLQLVLLGQPELLARLRAPEMSQFAQRVAAAFHLRPMGAREVAAYIRHRMAVAGAVRPVFRPEALAAIADITRGVPRLVNQLCDLALVYAFTAGRKTVGAGVIADVLNDNVFFALPAEAGGKAARAAIARVVK